MQAMKELGVRAGAADHMITSEMPAVPPASLCHSFSLHTLKNPEVSLRVYSAEKNRIHSALDVSEVRL